MFFKLLQSLFVVAIAIAQTAVATNSASAADPEADGKKTLALPERVTFNAHIRPIMSNTCFTCHGPDAEANESGFQIDSFAAAIGTLPSDDELVGIKPGDSQASEVYLRITGQSDGEVMPPADFRHRLSDYDKALFRRWIEQGAAYEQHWSYAPLRKPEMPTRKGDAEETVNPVDAFILARLAREGIEPSPLADRATLLRRLSLDLTGLPPTPAQVAAFEQDAAPEAFERQVDELLKSPHFGERMASGWLDLVRFADTVGFHGDQNQRIFPYRDYVIRAFNENKPFDQFTREQIAGDLLEQPTEEELTATGLLRLNMVTREGGAQPQEYLAKYKADRVRMLGTAWLGSTLACCECHNHKYDPFSIKDFYSLGAYFDDLQQWGVYSDYGYSKNPDLQGFNNDYPFPPELRVASESLRKEIAALQVERDQRLGELLSRTDSRQQLPTQPSLDEWLQLAKQATTSAADGWLATEVTATSTSDAVQVNILDDHSVLVTGEVTKDAVVKVQASVSQPIWVTAIRLEVLPDATHDGHVGRGKDGRFELSLKAAVDESTPLEFASIQADRQTPRGYTSGHSPISVQMPWQSGPAAHQLPKLETQLPHTAVFHLQRPLRLTDDSVLNLTIDSPNVGRVRVSLTPFPDAIAGWPAAEEALVEAINIPPAEQTTPQTQRVLSAYHRSVQPQDQRHELANHYREEIAKAQSAMAMTLVAQGIPSSQRTALVSRVLPRGNWQDESGELAPPQTPHFLPAMEDGDTVHETSGANDTPSRLQLAEWLVSRDNPLVARHFANRTWKQFFGIGLSSKLDDLGSQGEWPSHPQLLDWLAADFRDSGWDVKHLIRTIVTSRTYRQTAANRRDLIEIDPYNRLLAQQSPRRLEAEIIRDNALAISGLLQADYVGGPSVFPYQPDGHYSNLQFPNRNYIASVDYRQYRRGVYMHWQRTFLHPMLVNFDAPSRDECAADRSLSNSPQQALTLLNDPSFVEAAVAFARRLADETPDADFPTRLEHGFRLALARPATEAERIALQSLYTRQLEHYRASPESAKELLSSDRFNGSFAETTEPAQLAAWVQVCRVVLNLQETITRY